MARKKVKALLGWAVIGVMGFAFWGLNALANEPPADETGPCEYRALGQMIAGFAADARAQAK